MHSVSFRVLGDPAPLDVLQVLDELELVLIDSIGVIDVAG